MTNDPEIVVYSRWQGILLVLIFVLLTPILVVSSLVVFIAALSFKAQLHVMIPGIIGALGIAILAFLSFKFTFLTRFKIVMSPNELRIRFLVHSKRIKWSEINDWVIFRERTERPEGRLFKNCIYMFLTDGTFFALTDFDINKEPISNGLKVFNGQKLMTRNEALAKYPKLNSFFDKAPPRPFQK
jgi:hypothetical protein